MCVCAQLTSPWAAETERWVGEIRAVMAAHEKEVSVHGTLRVRVLEGRNLCTRDLSGLASPYWSAYLESQVRRHTIGCAINCANARARLAGGDIHDGDAHAQPHVAADAAVGV